MLYLFFLVPVTVYAVATKSAFEDQRPNYVAPESYRVGLRKFMGENFQTMFVDKRTRRYHLGAKNIFYVFDIDDPLEGTSNVRNYTWHATSAAVESCVLKGTPLWECQNYIQVLLPNSEDGGFLACGTNAQAPLCRYFEDSSLVDYDEVNGVTKCPFLPDQKSTSLFVDGKLFAATVADFTGRDSVFSTSIRSRILLSSVRLNSLWLKIPEFIASFEVDDWIVFFFRERSAEPGNSGEIIYPRVAKVCKNDIGGEWVLMDQWTTFQKARLNCSFAGAFPFYFHYLQDAVAIKDGKGDTVFYGLFTTGDHEIPGSAVCSFRLSTIRDIFDRGKYRGREMGKWYTVPDDEVPVPRPGACVEDSFSQRDDVLMFIWNHPIMDKSVPNDDGSHPLFYLTRADFRLMQIAVHRIGNVDVLFLGSDDGRLLKVASFKDDRGKLRFDVLEEIPIAAKDTPEGILEIIINEENNILLLTTNTTVTHVPMERCINLSPCACRRDPYCVLNATRNTTGCIKQSKNGTSHFVVDVGAATGEACPQKVIEPCQLQHSSTSAPLTDGQNRSCTQDIPYFIYVLLAVGWTTCCISTVIALVMSLLYKKVSRRSKGVACEVVYVYCKNKV